MYNHPEAEVLVIEFENSFASPLPGGTEPYTRQDVDPEFE